MVALQIPAHGVSLSQPDYTAKIDALLARAAELGFEAIDFAELAVAAADQAGASAKVQWQIVGLLGTVSK